MAHYICAATGRLVYHRPGGGTYPFSRHGVFPAILCCCRTTHREGSAVLYGENKFHVLCIDSRVLNSWPLAPASLALFGHVSLAYDRLVVRDRLFIDRLAVLPPGLKRLDLYGMLTAAE